MTSAQHTILDGVSRSTSVEHIDGPREISFEEMDAVSGGNEIKWRLGMIKLRAKGHGCTTQILLTCLDIV